MTRVDFYGLPEQATGDRFVVACRLVDKAYGQGHRVYVHTASEQEARHLSRLLWTFRQNSFIPHGLPGEVDGQLTPVLIGWERDPEEENDVLLNLTAQVPAFFRRFQRVLEPIDGDAEARRGGRERFRFYREQGFPPEYHELSP